LGKGKFVSRKPEKSAKRASSIPLHETKEGERENRSTRRKKNSTRRDSTQASPLPLGRKVAFWEPHQKRGRQRSPVGQERPPSGSLEGFLGKFTLKALTIKWSMNLLNPSGKKALGKGGPVMPGGVAPCRIRNGTKVRWGRYLTSGKKPKGGKSEKGGSVSRSRGGLLFSEKGMRKKRDRRLYHGQRKENASLSRKKTPLVPKKKKKKGGAPWEKSSGCVATVNCNEKTHQGEKKKPRKSGWLWKERGP